MDRAATCRKVRVVYAAFKILIPTPVSLPEKASVTSLEGVLLSGIMKFPLPSVALSIEIG